MSEYLCLKCKRRFEAEIKHKDLTAKCPECKRALYVVKKEHPFGK